MNKKTNSAILASLSTVIGSEAAVVQITQTGNSLDQLSRSIDSSGNLVVTFADNLSADLTGDGVDDITIADIGRSDGTSLSAGGNYLGGRINGTYVAAAAGQEVFVRELINSFCVSSQSQSVTETKQVVFQPGDTTCNGLTATMTTTKNCGIVRIDTFFTSAQGVSRGGFDGDLSSYSGCELIEISFNDPTYGGQVEAWLQINHTTGAGFSLSRVIFDDANPSVRPVASCDDPAYLEASSVPEPSSIALLAMGAGGILLRRNRKAA